MSRTVPKTFISFHEASVLRINASRILVAQGVSLANFVDLQLREMVSVTFQRTTEATPQVFGSGSDAFEAYSCVDRTRPENIKFSVPTDNPLWQEFGAYFEFLDQAGVARVLVEGTDARTKEAAFLELFNVKLHTPRNGVVTGQLYPLNGQPINDILGDYGHCEGKGFTFTPAALLRRETLASSPA